MKFPVFRDDRHEAFYYRMLAERRCTDSYHRALFYTLGLSKDTSAHIQELFDFSDGGIKPEGLSASWQTGGSLRICRLAFNLWNGWSQAGEERYSTPYELFVCEAAPFFFERYVCAIRNMLANRHPSSSLMPNARGETRMNEEKLPLSSPPADRDRDSIHKMQLGKSLYIVQCHFFGNETLGDKIERLVLRTLEEEAFRSR